MITILRYVEHTCEQDQRPLNSRDRFLQGIELQEGEVLSLPMQPAPLISPGGDPLGQFEQEGSQQVASCQVALHGRGHGGHAGQRLPSPFRHTQVTYKKTE